MRPNPFHLSGCALSIHLSSVGCLHHHWNRNNRILLEISHGFDFRILTFIATRALFNIHILLENEMECDAELEFIMVIRWAVIVTTVYIIGETVLAFVKIYRLKIRRCKNISLKCYITERVRPQGSSFHIV